ncbi:BspA family leucine-rich repeat surface protein [Butyrivibrio sp. WCD3002]|uniref:BspA family leucine-rich repeat surface protein n=1 Tax=Butyrivibrio sp. WCD3002 TaxID=1280676 RepID=UPI000428B026|nr:BspA family leucine-rich repeat surface protein [Butyrivibrio sp. WCD3002]
MSFTKATKMFFLTMVTFLFISLPFGITAKAETSGELLSGSNFNFAIKRLVDPNVDPNVDPDIVDDTTITEIEFLSTGAAQPTSGVSAAVGTDVTAYYDSSSKKISIYTTASKFYFNNDSSHQFSSFEGLQTLTLGNKIDTSNVNTMECMFLGCEALTALNLTGFNTSNTEYMDTMFGWCENLANINLSSFDTSNLKSAHALFLGCRELTSVNVSHFNTSKVENMCQMFDECPKLNSVDITNFDMTNVKYADLMFNISSNGHIYLPESFHKFDTYWYYWDTIPDAFSELNTSVTVHYPGTISQWAAFGYTFPNVVCTNGTPIILSDNTASLTTTEYDYTGSPITPSVKVTYNGTVLTDGTHYTLEYANNTNAGTAAVIIKGKSPYVGTINKSFTIKQKAITSATLTLSESIYTYDGTVKEPAVAVVLDGKALTIGTDYTVAYANNTNAGTATVTVTGSGNYTGIATTNFTIKEKEDDSKSQEEQKTEQIDPKQKNTTIAKPKAGKKSFTITWKKAAKGIAGYEMQYSTDKNFKNDVKTVTISKTKTTSKTIKKLKSKKKYYIRIRTYKKSGAEKVYSKWSKTKSVKVK